MTPASLIPATPSLRGGNLVVASGAKQSRGLSRLDCFVAHGLATEGSTPPPHNDDFAPSGELKMNHSPR
ncbi:MAG: hypothetical protein LBT00_09180 [Spirochaetaceae bacterium]|nr:hypothetical protein [Spirochaetaceae bacterium]